MEAQNIFQDAAHDEENASVEDLTMDDDQDDVSSEASSSLLSSDDATLDARTTHSV